MCHATAPSSINSKYSKRIELMVNQIKELFCSIPENINDFILASQISQAEANKFFIEMTRLKKWQTTGVIWWNMADGWPQFSDAVVDYYNNKKLAFYYIKHAQQPICIMMSEPENWHIRVMIGNDSCIYAEGEYRIWDADTNELVMNGEFSSVPNSNITIGKIKISRSEKRMFLIQWSYEGKTYGNHYMLGYPPFDLDKYKNWMKKISSIYCDFDPLSIGF